MSAVRPRTLERYLGRQIYAATGFVLLGFLALFAFFDLIGELGDLGKGDYDLRQVFTFVLLNAPAHAYELFPIVVLIGTLYVLAHLASNSEYTVMRGSGLSPARAEYREKGVWELYQVIATRFDPEPHTERGAQAEWRSAVSPDLLNALIVKPERMSAWALHKYTQHLESNRQKTERYEIAFWKKLFYPLAALVMMALALPFAYMHARAGMVGVKVFLGIMLGIFFHLLNSLFSHIGLLQNWPPLAAAAVPSTAFLASAMLMMWWVERR